MSGNWDITAHNQKFPLIQLPKKFKDMIVPPELRGEELFPLIQLPKKFKVFDRSANESMRYVSINSTSEEV